MLVPSSDVSLNFSSEFTVSTEGGGFVGARKKTPATGGAAPKKRASKTGLGLAPAERTLYLPLGAGGGAAADAAPTFAPESAASSPTRRGLSPARKRNLGAVVVSSVHAQAVSSFAKIKTGALADEVSLAELLVDLVPLRRFELDETAKLRAWCDALADWDDFLEHIFSSNSYLVRGRRDEDRSAYNASAYGRNLTYLGLRGCDAELLMKALPSALTIAYLQRHVPPAQLNLTPLMQRILAVPHLAEKVLCLSVCFPVMEATCEAIQMYLVFHELLNELATNDIYLKMFRLASRALADALECGSPLRRDDDAARVSIWELLVLCGDAKRANVFIKKLTGALGKTSTKVSCANLGSSLDKVIDLVDQLDYEVAISDILNYLKKASASLGHSLAVLHNINTRVANTGFKTLKSQVEKVTYERNTPQHRDTARSPKPSPESPPVAHDKVHDRSHRSSSGRHSRKPSGASSRFVGGSRGSDQTKASPFATFRKRSSSGSPTPQPVNHARSRSMRPKHGLDVGVHSAIPPQRATVATPSTAKRLTPAAPSTRSTIAPSTRVMTAAPSRASLRLKHASRSHSLECRDPTRRIWDAQSSGGPLSCLTTGATSTMAASCDRMIIKHPRRKAKVEEPARAVQRPPKVNIENAIRRGLSATRRVETLVCGNSPAVASPGRLTASPAATTASPTSSSSRETRPRSTRADFTVTYHRVLRYIKQAYEDLKDVNAKLEREVNEVLSKRLGIWELSTFYPGVRLPIGMICKAIGVFIETVRLKTAGGPLTTRTFQRTRREDPSALLSEAVKRLGP